MLKTRICHIPGKKQDHILEFTALCSIKLSAIQILYLFFYLYNKAYRNHLGLLCKTGFDSLEKLIPMRKYADSISDMHYSRDISLAQKL